jgi:translation initiation factor IF-2
MLNILQTTGDLMEDKEEIGEVFKYFVKPSVAAINITSGELKVGDTIQIKGETTDFIQKIDSMEIDNVKVEVVHAGQGVGIKVMDRARPNDKVYRLKIEL